ncbi:major facilitator superfamily transporter [Enterococcus saccharolyticus]|nr:major facilitator superfamily transporter [Enterococcus saccharolyticus]
MKECKGSEEMERKTNTMIVTIAIFVATFMTAVEGTIVTTAMPTIVGSLHGIEIMNWVFSIYLLTNAMLTPIYGKLADKVGRKPIFIFGTAIFIIGSALCGLSNAMLPLIISRAIQGIGAGAMMPVALTILADLYDTEKRARMLGLNSTAWGVASVIGPLAGGLIVDTIGWHWIFFINVPIGLVLIALIVIFLVEPKRVKDTKKMDFLGSIFLMLILLSLLLGFQYLSEPNATWKVLALFSLTIVSFILFIKVEKRAEDPVISLNIFSNHVFVIVNIVAALSSGFLMGIEVYIPMWMQGVLGLSAGIGGLVLAPLSIMWVMGSSMASRWMTNKTVHWVLTASLFIILVGGLGLFLAPANTPIIVFILLSAITGTGMGAVTVTGTVVAQNSVPTSQLGMATSFNTLVRTIGQTIMVSVFGITFNMVTSAQLAKSALTDDPDIMNKLVNPQTAKLLTNELLLPLRGILHQGLQVVYGFAAFLIIIALIFTQTLRKKRAIINKNT